MRISVFLSFILLVSCQSVEQKVIDEYFDVTGLIHEQFQLLELKRATLSKVAIFGSDTAKADIVPDSSQWKNELRIFERIDINKPQWRGQYQIEDTEDRFSNLTIRTFTTTNDEAEVKYLRLYFLDHVADLRKIEARWQENNPIYKSQRDLTLHFEDINDSIILNGYEIKGIQKMTLQDEVSFSINAGINHP
ncbi:MAG: hypothetical protein AAGA64_03160 [Bacteroidota bacterium]